jgi:hypothetical protein
MSIFNKIKIVLLFAPLIFIYAQTALEPINSKVLLEIPQQTQINLLEFGSDGNLFVYSFSKDNIQTTEIRSKDNVYKITEAAISTSSFSIFIEKEYSYLPLNGLRFITSKRKHFGYIKQDFKELVSEVFLDGKNYGKFSLSPQPSVSFSEDEEHWGLAGFTSDGKLKVIIDGEEVIKGDEDFVKDVKPGEIKFILSPDGKRYALKIGNIEKSYLIVDGQKVLEADDIGNVVFSQDSQKIAYDYRKNLEKFLVFYNKETKIDCVIPINSLLITKDNKLVYICVKDKQKHYLIFKDKKFGPYDRISNPSLLTKESEDLLLYPFKLSDDHSRIAFKAKKGRKEILVIDGKEKLSLDKKSILFFIFHPNKKDILYAYRDLKSNKVVLFENNKIKMRADYISSPIFSKDIKKITYYITKGKSSYIFLNHKVYSKPYSSILDYKFSPDSKHLVFVAIKGKKVCLVIDKKESCKYNAVEFFDPIQFSEDGQKVYIGGLVDNKIVWDTYELK